MNFYVWLNEQQQGPYDVESIEKMISSGHITPETLVCPESGDLDWTSAKELFLQDSTPENFAILELDSKPNDSLIEIKVNHFHSFFYQKAKTDNSRLRIRLNSGAELKIKAVRLYDESTLSAIHTKRLEAKLKHQGVSTGPGSIGSLEWVLASSMVIGAIEGVLSANAAQSGDDSLLEAIRLEHRLREKPHFLPVELIQKINDPIPSFWRVPGESRIQIPPQQKPGLIRSAFIHNGDEFVTVQTDDGAICSIRWDSVESYAYDMFALNS